jgi:type IV secretory pathway VirB4 component
MLQTVLGEFSDGCLSQTKDRMNVLQDDNRLISCRAFKFYEISNSLPSGSFKMAYLPQSIVVSSSENSTPFLFNSNYVRSK